LDLGSGKPFDDPHRSTTLGAESKIVRVIGGGWFWLGLRCRAEQVKAKRQQRGASPVGQEAEVANAHEAFGKHVQQEAAQEFIEWKGQQLLFVVVSGVAPTESDLAVGQRDQAMVGDGHAVRVAAQILEHILGAAEGSRLQ
jgi:hypothetical protein